MSAVPASTDEKPWRRFICRACGFIYDERDGDPDGGLAPGTRFDDIPDDWACPLCGVSKKDFDPYDGSSTTREQRSAAVVFAARARRGVVIVGGGLAGWSAARELRAADPGRPITLVAADAADVYSKPALSLAFGSRKSARELVSASGRDAADALSIRLLARTQVVAIDASHQRIRTTRGPVDYETLVLATGARPIAASTLPDALCWRINDIDAWTRLHAVLGDGPRRVAVIGAGLVGCELADDLAHAGHAVTVFDPGVRPLAAWASIDESRRLLDGWSRLGVAFVPSVSITRLERRSVGGRTVTVIHTDDDALHDADLVIAAVGLAVDTRLARTAGLAIDRGIAVSADTMRTSDPSIHAIGDCVSIDGRPCRFIEPIARQAKVIASAILHGEVAAAPHRAPVVRLKTRSAPMTLSGGDRA